MRLRVRMDYVGDQIQSPPLEMQFGKEWPVTFGPDTSLDPTDDPTSASIDTLENDDRSFVPEEAPIDAESRLAAVEGGDRLCSVPVTASEAVGVANPWHPGMPMEYRNQIVCGEALDVLLRLPSDSVDGVLTDPPYSSGGAYRSDRMGDVRNKYCVTERTTQKVFHAFSGDNRDQRSYEYWCALWLSQCLRVTRPGGVICMFTDWRQLPVSTDALQAGGWVWRGIVPWNKTEAARPMQGRFRNQCEYVVWGSKGDVSVNDDKCLPGFVTHYAPLGEKEHIAQKPLGVLRQLLALWRGGSVILDPFAGFGSTAVACVEEGHSFIGIEQEASWAERANERLRMMTPRLLMAPVDALEIQTSLFD